MLIFFFIILSWNEDEFYIILIYLIDIFVFYIYDIGVEWFKECIFSYLKYDVSGVLILIKLWKVVGVVYIDDLFCCYFIDLERKVLEDMVWN